MKYSHWANQLWGTWVLIAKNIMKKGFPHDTKRRVVSMLNGMRVAMPCDRCGPHYNTFATDERIQRAVANNTGLRDFTLDLFNDVNTRTGKPTITWDEMSKFTATENQVWEAIHAITLNPAPNGEAEESARRQVATSLMYLFPTDCTVCSRTLRLYVEADDMKYTAGEWAWNAHMLTCRMRDGGKCKRCVSSCAGVTPFKAMVAYYGSGVCKVGGTCDDVLPVPNEKDLKKKIGRAPRGSPLFVSNLVSGTLGTNARCPKWFWRAPKFFTPAGIALWVALAAVLAITIVWLCMKRHIGRR